MRLEDVTAQSRLWGGGPTNLRPLVRHGPLLPLDGRSEHSFKKRRGGTQLSGRNEYLLPLPERRPFFFFFFFFNLVRFFLCFYFFRTSMASEIPSSLIRVTSHSEQCLPSQACFFLVYLLTRSPV